MAAQLEGLVALLRSPGCSLSQLFLEGNPIGDEGAIALAEGLARNTTLVVLMVSECRFTLAGASRLAASLEAHPRLSHLDFGVASRGRYEPIEGRVEEQAPAGRAFGQLLASAPRLARLTMAHIPLQPAFLGPFVAGLGGSASLEHLTLGQLPPGEEGRWILSLLRAVGAPRPVSLSLKKLGVSCLRLGNPAESKDIGVGMADLLRRNAVLEDITFSNCAPKWGVVPDGPVQLPGSEMKAAMEAALEGGCLAARCSVAMGWAKVERGDRDTRAEEAKTWLRGPSAAATTAVGPAEGSCAQRVTAAGRACCLLRLLREGPFDSGEAGPVGRHVGACLRRAAEGVLAAAEGGRGDGGGFGSATPAMVVEAMALVRAAVQGLQISGYRPMLSAVWGEGWSMAGRRRLWVHMAETGGLEAMRASIRALERAVGLVEKEDGGGGDGGEETEEAGPRQVGLRAAASALAEDWSALEAAGVSQRRVQLAEWMHCRCARRDAALVLGAAAGGRPLELQKRLWLGKLAGGLSMRGVVVVDGGGKREAGPLEAARLGGHTECVRVLQEAMGL